MWQTCFFAAVSRLFAQSWFHANRRAGWKRRVGPGSARPAESRPVRALLETLSLNLMPSSWPPFADSVSVDSRTTTAYPRSDKRTFFSTRNAADNCADSSASGSGQLIAVFLPEASPMPMTITDATGMCVRGIAMPVPQPAAGPRRHRHRQKRDKR